MVSHWLGWISFGFSILLLLEYVVKRSKIKKAIRMFSKSHRTFSVIMMMTGLTHGTILLIKGTVHTAAIITGIFLFGCALFVCNTCIHRHQNKKMWMKFHRIGSAAIVLLLLIHIFLR